MKVFGKYLWQYRWTALMFFGYACIFSMIFFLYDLETEAVWYAAGLCVLVTVVILVIQFYGFIRKHRQLERIGRSVELLLGELPKPYNLPEEDYQNLLRRLKAVFDENSNLWQNERRESLDYYTTWVHEIKTPIAVMRMILQGEDTEANRELSAELFRIEKYVEMALGYLRLGNESSDFVFREQKLDGIIRQVIHEYAPYFVRNRIRLNYEGTEARVLTDEKWLRFMIEQVLSNAVKYARGGCVSITVTQDKVLKIADTGIGIAPEDVPRIFEKGFTGYNGRADKKATGLGLYLCRLTANKLSHKVSAESAVGVGTVISIDLRRDELEVE